MALLRGSAAALPRRVLSRRGGLTRAGERPGRGARHDAPRSSAAVRVQWALCRAVMWAGLVLQAALPRLAAAQQPTAAQFGEPIVIDGLAAVLGGADPLEPPRPILQSDVELRARLALLVGDEQRALYGPLPHSLLSATLDELIGQHLIAIEAERVQIPAPRPSDIAHELRNLEREAGGRGELARLLERVGATRRDLQAMALRRALVSAFLRANLEGVNVVTDAEVEDRLRAEPERFAGETPQGARAAARALLAREALMRNIGHWVRVLRARTRVRIFAAYGSS